MFKVKYNLRNQSIRKLILRNWLFSFLQKIHREIIATFYAINSNLVFRESHNNVYFSRSTQPIFIYSKSTMGNTRTMLEICSALTPKTPERR